MLKVREENSKGGTQMEIRKTRHEDLPRLNEIYAYARNFMAENGNPNQWGPTNWPPAERLVKDVEEGNGYVCLDDEGIIVGCFYFIQGYDIDPTYREITNGAWLSDSSYGVVHRIASSGDVKGVATYCINWAYEQCGHLRIDTHGDNVPMQGLMKKLGFVECGTIFVEEDDYPRIAYEKI